jgi:hypothetical protein
MNHTLQGISSWNHVDGYTLTGKISNSYGEDVLIFQMEGEEDEDTLYAQLYSCEDENQINFETNIYISANTAIELGLTTQQEVDKNKDIEKMNAEARTTKYKTESILSGIKHLKETGMSPRDITKIINGE